MSFRLSLLLAATITSIATTADASPLVVGSGNEAVIQPSVPHPNETPCVVTLTYRATFGSDAVPLYYVPPTACPRPWAAVVLTMYIELTKGRQYDRTGALFLAGVPLWFGTTAEPSSTLGPHWSFEKDVTDYTALFGAGQTGYLQIPNYYSATITSTITATATLSFYPATKGAPAPVTADMVIPFPTGGGLATLNTSTDQAATTGTLPTNIARATLDVYLQGQIGDEFWYLCVPTALASELESCGNTSFREGEISIDGIPAGVAPIYPWIFTGGIDPYLWRPIPGVQTLSFVPFHADLSPFAGVLSNGQTHSVAASVFNANGYFSATGALRLFLDKTTTAVTGSIVQNTLAAPAPNVVQTITTANGISTGNVDVTSAHDFTIIGTVTGPAGTTRNTLSQTSHFLSNQRFNVSTTNELQVASQKTDTSIRSSSVTLAGTAVHTERLQYPLGVNYRFKSIKGGNYAQYTTVDQQYVQSGMEQAGGIPVSQNAISNAILASDTLYLDSNFSITGNADAQSTAAFLRTGTTAPCFARKLESTANLLSKVQTGCQ